jgi:hypothetical protein
MSTGQLALHPDHRLMAQAFDVVSLRLKGEAVAVAEPVVQQYAFRGKGDFSVSASWRARVPRWSHRTEPAWSGSIGTASNSARSASPRSMAPPVLSPDGRRTAGRAVQSRVTHHRDGDLADRCRHGHGNSLDRRSQAELHAACGPLTGDQVTFASRQGNVNNLVQTAVNGIPAEHLVFEGNTMVMPESWSADLIFYSVYDKTTGYDMWALPLSGDRKPFPILRSEHWESQAQLSPDGQLLSYTSDESGQLEVYVTSFPSRKGTRQISIGGGGDARWRRDGHELFYIASDGRLMAVAIDPEPNFTHGAPQAVVSNANSTALGRHAEPLRRDRRRSTLPVHGTD